MKTIEKQLRNIINNNIPKTIDLQLPLNKDKNLQDTLNQLYLDLNAINQKVNSIENLVKSIYIHLKTNDSNRNKYNYLNNYNKYWG